MVDTLAVDNVAPLPPRRLRMWPAVVLVLVYWAAVLAINALQLPTFSGFLAQLAALGGFALLFGVWWMFQRAVPLRDRWVILIACCAVLFVIIPIVHRSVLVPLIAFTVPPWMLTAGTVWLLVTRGRGPRVWRRGLLAIAVLSVAWVPFIRMEGLTGGGQADMRWRWTKTHEEKLLAGGAGAAKRGTPSTTQAVVARSGDWSDFRGTKREGSAAGVTVVDTDWTHGPPSPVWKKEIGPAWSSMLVVGGRLYTQAQLGESEQVVCLDALSGEPIWVHEDRTRFSEQLGGVGPRGTPTFAGGKIYSQGAKGLLTCLDAASGGVVWSADVTKLGDAPVPMWGFSSSPLVVGDKVIAFAGGNKGKALLALDAGTGKLIWSADGGAISYSSPQLMTLGGKAQVVMVADGRTIAYDVETGKVLWKHQTANSAVQPTVQPRAVGDSQVLVSYGADPGTSLLGVALQNGEWKVSEVWTSRQLKPFYNDSVLYHDYLYGFDGQLFACVDVKTGQRKWKAGRYGGGQAVLLSDKGQVVVLTETGELVLLAASPEKSMELGRFQAIEGKTWNHPAVADGRLYVRNAEQIACFDLLKGAVRTASTGRE